MIEQAEDLVGFRVTCHNIQDVSRAASLLFTSLTESGLKPRKRDYVAKPKKDGYRAIHIVFKCPAKIASDEAVLGCEIQIRSLLQDSWAQLSRVDLYAISEDLPRSVSRDMQRLSVQLAKAGRIANSIRTTLARPRKGRKPVPGQPPTSAALAFIYRERFGSDPPEYLIQWVLREYGGRALRTDGLEAALQDDEFQRKLSQAYSEPSGVLEAGNEALFRWSVDSLVSGKDVAIRRARADGRGEWQDIERIARSETMSRYPDNVDDLVRHLHRSTERGDDVDYEIEELSSGLGGSGSCARCGTRLVDAETLSEGAVSHYHVRGRKRDRILEEIMDAVSRSGVEMGEGGLCSYCSHVLSKDG